MFDPSSIVQSFAVSNLEAWAAWSGSEKWRMQSILQVNVNDLSASSFLVHVEQLPFPGRP